MEKDIDNSSKILESIKHCLFEKETVTNSNKISHNLNFVTHCGDGECFIVADSDNKEYRVRVSKEIE